MEKKIQAAGGDDQTDIEEPDINIDFRRVKNLRVYLVVQQSA